MAGGECNSGGGCFGRGVLNLVYIWTVSSFLLLVTFLNSVFNGKTKTVRKAEDGKKKRTIAFFHPYCNAGGGGERVLWAAIRSLQHTPSSSSTVDHFVIFTGDVGASPSEILAKARNNFNIIISPSNIEFIFLTRRNWVESSSFPMFTLLGQSLGSIYLGLEAFSSFVPDIFIDTMGYAFTLPLFKYLGGSRVAAYVHYQQSVRICFPKLLRETPPTITKGGRSGDHVNSSWTEGHILQLWKKPETTFKVYPPCDVQAFKELKRNDEDQDKRTINIVSVAQFRPEKDHQLQIRAMKELKEIVLTELWQRCRLVLVGSVRNQGDQERVDYLKELSKELGVEENCVFIINCSFDTLKNELANGLVGIHSMWNEHFGISVVESMAAGLLMVAHKSGGPLMDIVVDDEEGDRNGFLAQDQYQYARAIKNILLMSPEDQERIRKRARSSVDRFSDQEFDIQFRKAFGIILQ
ncbi:GDP-Man:Man(3)GlcNAc(2)-PP-Dol alpha-1,2-mannosyltransferase [Orchesella cincta]|uniref:GDP-Man:Man(3)GlcNAc(2)-PP-Dol alpha-1,2-mannosyltransferase n=1 Tax=Orchesella cincta TaxID=48709 RepID=A0A1D2MF19_ORCCI|nr:GDP-Man:Man(3)GlcNAc(2)-PP-Dol alpha-1,2-mannosyltransferase [Orchesella cincta]